MGQYLSNSPSERAPFPVELASYQQHAEGLVRDVEALEDGSTAKIQDIEFSGQNQSQNPEMFEENETKLSLLRETIAKSMKLMAEEKGVRDVIKLEWVLQNSKDYLGKRTVRKNMQTLYHEARGGNAVNVAGNLKQIFDKVWEGFLAVHEGVRVQEADSDAQAADNIRPLRKTVQAQVARAAKPAPASDGRWPDLHVELGRLGFASKKPADFIEKGVRHAAYGSERGVERPERRSTG